MQSEPRSIPVPGDDTVRTEVAVDLAFALAEGTEATVIMLQVVESASYAQSFDDAAAVAERTMQLRRPGVIFETRIIRSTDPATSISGIRTVRANGENMRHRFRSGRHDTPTLAEAQGACSSYLTLTAATLTNVQIEIDGPDSVARRKHPVLHSFQPGPLTGNDMKLGGLPAKVAIHGHDDR